MFPSPPGTSYFLMEYRKSNNENEFLFPSPPGTSYFLIIRRNFTPSIIKVSVPSGDFLFFNFVKLVHVTDPTGFRPLWGLSIF